MSFRPRRKSRWPPRIRRPLPRPRSRRAARRPSNRQTLTVELAPAGPAPFSSVKRRRRSAGFLEELAPDQHAPDLARAGADLVELGIAQKPSGRIIIDIAVAAETLHGVEANPGRALGREEDGARRIFAR